MNGDYLKERVQQWDHELGRYYANENLIYDPNGISAKLARCLEQAIGIMKSQEKGGADLDGSY